MNNFTVVNYMDIFKIFSGSKKLLFYDTCSIIKHSSCDEESIKSLCEYFLKEDYVPVVINSIFEELLFGRNTLEYRFTVFFQRLSKYGCDVIFLDEIIIYDVLQQIFGSIKQINSQLLWALRYLGIQQKDLNVESRINFKTAVTNILACKQKGDNLGEEMCALCIYFLTMIPIYNEGCIAFLSEDKRAAVMVNRLIRNSRILFFSTPKLIQHMYKSGVIKDKSQLELVLKSGNSGNISIRGITPYDFDSFSNISGSARDIAQMIVDDTINIIF